MLSQRMTLRNTEWPFQASRAMSAVVELIILKITGPADCKNEDIGQELDKDVFASYPLRWRRPICLYSCTHQQCLGLYICIVLCIRWTRRNDQLANRLISNSLCQRNGLSAKSPSAKCPASEMVQFSITLDLSQPNIQMQVHKSWQTYEKNLYGVTDSSDSSASWARSTVYCRDSWNYAKITLIVIFINTHRRGKWGIFRLSTAAFRRLRRTSVQ